jgi:glycosyltransferase involved in cell wall biosynthesis
LTNREFRIAGKTLVYQPAVRKVTGTGFDGAVIGAELKLLANVVLFSLLKLKRRPVLLWGQGVDKRKDEGPVMRLLSGSGSFIRLAAARRADGYAVYTSAGRDRLADAGVDPSKVFVIRNTLDVEAESELHRRFKAEPEHQLREELGLRRDSIVLLFIGRIYREKRISEFVSLLRALRDRDSSGPPVEGVVIGAGPDLERTQKQAQGLGDIHFLGEIRNSETVGRYMRVASAVVIPGAVGLAVNHAFAHGVPIITQEGPMQGPEFEYLEAGRNSVVTNGIFGEFVSAVADFVDSPQQRETLAQGALRSRESLTVASMASSFHRAACATFGVSGVTTNMTEVSVE